MDKKRIEDMIAEARAEEELRKKEMQDNSLRDAIKNTLDAHKPQVTIDLEEYVMLRTKANDLDRLLLCIMDALGLNYTNEDLMIRDDRKILEAFKVLYGDAYTTILAAELDNLVEEGE